VFTITKESVLVKLDFNTLLNACIELTTVNGRPFSMLEDSGFQTILNPILKALGENQSINRHNIIQHISEAANSIRNEIICLTKNKLISLKIDGVTRKERSILGINVQLMVDDKLVVKTLAMVELFEKQTAENLKNVVAIHL